MGIRDHGILPEDIYYNIIHLLAAEDGVVHTGLDGKIVFYSREQRMKWLYNVAEVARGWTTVARALAFREVTIKAADDLGIFIGLVTSSLSTIAHHVKRIVIGAPDQAIWPCKQRTWLHDHIDVRLLYHLLPSLQALRLEALAGITMDEHRCFREFEMDISQRVVPQTIRVLSLREDFFKHHIKLTQFLHGFPSLQRLRIDGPSHYLLEALPHCLPPTVLCLKLVDDISSFPPQCERPPPGLTWTVSKSSLREIHYWNMRNSMFDAALAFLSRLVSNQNIDLIDMAYPRSTKGMEHAKYQKDHIAQRVQQAARIIIRDEKRTVVLALPASAAGANGATLDIPVLWQKEDEACEVGLVPGHLAYGGWVA